jgi:hypothetical protein
VASEVINQSAGSHLMGGGGSCERGEGDDMTLCTVSWSMVLGFLALLVLCGSYWKEVEIANRIPITVKMNAVVVIVLTIWNFTAAIR